MNKRITLLVDGEYLLKRSFLSKASNYYTPQFGSINGLFNFMLSLRKITKYVNANKIVICWDGENGGKLRYNIYEGYKANREHKEWYRKIELTEKQIHFENNKKESLLKNKVRIQQYLEEMFIRQIYGLDVIEADDIIAHYVHEYHDKESITIFTNDRDLCQLVEYDSVNIYLGNIKQLINNKTYFMTFHHDYRNLRLVKTFCGDASDNIKGVKGVKEKTFIKLFPKIIREPVTIEEILEEAHKIKEKRKIAKENSLKVLDNIIQGVNTDKEVLGNELYSLNYKLVNLFEPFLTREAKHVIKEMSENPLDPENRGSVNLIKYMNEDGFRTIWNGTIDSFCSPFYPTIVKEKEFSKKF